MREIIQTTATGVTIHIPAIPNGWQTALVLAAFAVAFALFLGLLKNLPSLRKAKWPDRLKRTPWWLMAIFFVSVFVAPFWLILFVRTFFLTFEVFTVAGDLLAKGNTETLRWYALAIVGLLTALGGLLAAPLAIVRTHATERQTRTAEENLTTDLINKAVEGLGAEKEVSRVWRVISYEKDGVTDHAFESLTEPCHIPDNATVTKRGEWDVGARTKPNIEVRLGAIYALERIAQDSPRDHIRVMEILCAYLRENAAARDARRHDLGPWPDYPENPTKDDLKARRQALKERRKALAIWIDDLREHHAPRADIQAAITVIGRRSPAQIALEQSPEDNAPAYRLDLRKVNLQAADLSGLDLADAQLDASHLGGADLDGAHLEGADLFWAHLEGAHLSGTHLEGADLGVAALEGAHFDGAYLEGADLNGAYLSAETLFRPATLSGAGLANVNLAIAITKNDDLPRLLTEAFGDASVALPDGLTAGDPPLDHWSTDRLELGDFHSAWRAHQRAIGYVPPD